MLSEQDQLERLEQGLADRLELKVRTRVTASFLAMGVFVSGVVGFFGYNVVEGLKTSADRAGAELVVQMKQQVATEIERLTTMAQTEVETYINAADVRIARSVERSQEATNNASSAADSMLMQLRIIDEYLKRRQDTLTEAEKEAGKRNAKLVVMQGEVEGMQDEVSERVGDIRKSLSTVRDDIDTAQKDLLNEIAAQQESVRTRSSDAAAASREGLDALASGLEGLAVQVERMGAQLDALQQEISQAPATASVDAEELTQVVDYAQSQKIAPNAAADDVSLPAPSTVYVQFAGVSRDRIELLSKALREVGGYDIPGEERLSAAAGKREVRFFWDFDRQAAADLARHTNEVLQRQGYRGDITVNDMTKFPESRKPVGNTLELWLEPMPDK